MKASQEIEEIVCKMLESFMEVDGSTCWLGVSKYNELQAEFENKILSMGRSPGVRVGYITQYCTTGGILDVKVDPKLHPDHISVGRITLLDFLIEEMLLGDEKILDKYDPIANTNFGYYIGSEFSTEEPSEPSKSMRKRSSK